ncbi:MAG: hypothetical protein KA140_07450 [Caldisericia bacterium]|nr:hypothetical protein [Caldisericia bacterium]
MGSGLVAAAAQELKHQGVPGNPAATVRIIISDSRMSSFVMFVRSILAVSSALDQKFELVSRLEALWQNWLGEQIFFVRLRISVRICQGLLFYNWERL